MGATLDAQGWAEDRRARSTLRRAGKKNISHFGNGRICFRGSGYRRNNPNELERRAEAKSEESQN